MADTWITPTRKADLLGYIDQLKKLSGGPVEEEDLYAAGFSERDLDDIGWNAPAPKASTMAGDGSKLEAYTPTSRDNVRNNVSGALTGVGLDKQLARQIAVKVAGEENPADGGLGMGLADFTPMGALFGAEEGVNSAKRGYNSGSVTDTAMGVGNAALSVASALPGGKVVSQGVNKLAEKLAGQYDPSVVRTFFGPNSAKADLGKLKQAEQLAASGADEETVWMQTGWWNGPNGWRFEVDDSKMPLPLGSSEMDMHGKSRDAIQHKDFWDSMYPRDEMSDADFVEQESARFKVRDGDTSFGPMNAGREFKGAFDPKDNSMKAYGYTQDDQKETLVHEMQHAIQNVLGDAGVGASPDWVSKRLKQTLDEMPYDQQSAAGAAAEFGYSSVRLNNVELAISKFEKKVAEEATLNEEELLNSFDSSGEVPFGWGKVETSSSDKETLDALYKEQELLSERVRDYSSYLSSVGKAYPEFEQAVEEFKLLGQGIGEQYFATTPNLAEDLFSRKTVFNDSGELQDYAAHTLYTLEAGEVEARAAGKRAHLNSSYRGDYVPETDVVSKDYVYTQRDLNNWLQGVLEDSKKKKGYAKGGVVQEKDPVSGNEVPPGAEPVEVRDDIDAKLSDGEYVIPADVVRYLGLDKIEKLVAQAKEGLAEMDKQGRIGGEEVPAEDDLPFTDDELSEAFADDEGAEGEPPAIHMATGGVVTGDAIRNNVLRPPTATTTAPVNPADPTLPSWMQDTEVQPAAKVEQSSWADRQAEKTPMGMAGAVETWSAKDFSNAVKQRGNDPGTRVAEQIVKAIPFGGIAMKARNKYLDKKVPGAIDAMIQSGVDTNGKPLTPEQISGLQQAKIDFQATVGYKPQGIAPVIKETVRSLIKPKDKAPEKKSESESSKKDSSTKSDSAADKKETSKTSSSKSSSSSKKDDKKK
jgi:Large polyvalent protein associated domain 23